MFDWLLDLAKQDPLTLLLLAIIIGALAALAAVVALSKYAERKIRLEGEHLRTDTQRNKDLSGVITSLAATTTTMAEQWGNASTEIRNVFGAMKELTSKIDASLDQEAARIKFREADRHEQLKVQLQTAGSLEALRGELQSVAKSNREHHDQIVQELSNRVDANLKELRDVVTKEIHDQRIEILTTISEKLEEAWAGIRHEIEKMQEKQ